MTAAIPRQHIVRPALAGAGMPGDRQARVAGRRAFVDLKQVYLTAIEALPGPRAEWLRFQVRHAAEPSDLWLLRAAVFDALPRLDHGNERDTLQRGIDTVFPGSHGHSGFAPLL
jgi:hypothetical protein